jgi:hypothetical protein
MQDKYDLLVVHGMKRSGNHAIIYWLLKQRNMRFFNNVFPMGKVLKRGVNFPFPVRITPYLKRRARQKSGRWFFNGPVLGEAGTLVSIEDQFLDTPFFEDIPWRYRNLLILRDPYNLFASRIRRGRTRDHVCYPREYNDVFERAVSLWKQSFREFSGETSFLRGKQCVLYDAWLVDPSYRRSVAAVLGLELRDNDIGAQAREGGGSSFGDLGPDDDRYDPTGRLSRFMQLNSEEKKLFARVADDAELRQMREQLMAGVAASASSAEKGQRAARR